MWRLIFEWYVIGAFCLFVAMRISVVLLDRMGFERETKAILDEANAETEYPMSHTEYALIAGITFPILLLIFIAISRKSK